MKSIFSKTWNSSKQPRKQIKFRANAPNHIKRKFMSSLLDKPLRTKYGKRSMIIKKGDEVKILRGKFKGKLGKVSVVDIGYTRIQVDGAQRTKQGGEKLETWFHPSSVKIISLEDSDSKRFKLKKKVETPNKEDKKGKPISKNSSRDIPHKEAKKTVKKEIKK